MSPFSDWAGRRPKGRSMATVEVISPRTIRAKRIFKDLTREELRELARPGEKTSEYGSPVYATRVKNRSAKNTYVVGNGAPIGVMQQPIERDRAEETIREVQETLAGMELLDARSGKILEANPFV